MEERPRIGKYIVVSEKNGSEGCYGPDVVEAETAAEAGMIFMANHSVTHLGIVVFGAYHGEYFLGMKENLGL